MQCNPKTMIRIGAVIGVALLIAYFAFPEAQGLVLASAPLLLALICPVTMIVMMRAMRTAPDKPSRPDPLVAPRAPETAARRVVGNRRRHGPKTARHFRTGKAS